VTTMSDPQDVIRGLECGADNFVLKPYDEPYLLARVQYVLVNCEFRQKQETGMGVEISFNNQRHFITANRLQILDLLLSTYDAAEVHGEGRSRLVRVRGLRRAGARVGRRYPRRVESHA